MKHLVLPLVMVVGIIFGWAVGMPSFFGDVDLAHILLYILIIQVGLGIGMRPDLSMLFRNFNFRMLLLPAFTIVGTLAFTLLAGLIFVSDDIKDILAIGSGFGYYSLSSVLIAQFKSVTSGAEAASVVAAIALLANVVRELVALVSCKFLSSKGYGYAAISIAGINSMDVCLPMIVSGNNDRNLISAALFHGIMIEVSVPFLIALFCG